MTITAGRYGQTLDEQNRVGTVVALEDERDGRVKVRVANNGIDPGVIDVAVEEVDWALNAWLPLGESRTRVAWWRAPMPGAMVFQPFEFVMLIATIAERNNIAMDIAYVSPSGEPVNATDVTVLDMGYAAGAVLAQGVDMKRPIQVMRELDELLAFAPAIPGLAYDGLAEPYSLDPPRQRHLMSIPLDQVLSLRLRMPSLAELTECNCAYLLDAPNGYRKCAYCKQVEAENEHEAERQWAERDGTPAHAYGNEVTTDTTRGISTVGR